MTNKNLLSTLFVALLSIAIFTQCGEAKKGAENIADKTGEMADDAAKKVGDMADDASKKAGEMADDAKKVADDLTEMDSKEGSLSFDEGTWAYSVLQGLKAGNTTTFTLDQIPYDGSEEDELSDAANQQLDNLAEILKANPDWVIEVQGHTEKANNAVGATKKKATSKVRAMWVQGKLNLRGITGKQISSAGKGDDNLLSGLEPKDNKHRRITIALTKGGEAS